MSQVARSCKAQLFTHHKGARHNQGTKVLHKMPIGATPNAKIGEILFRTSGESFFTSPSGMSQLLVQSNFVTYRGAFANICARWVFTKTYLVKLRTLQVDSVRIVDGTTTARHHEASRESIMLCLDVEW